MRPAPAGAGRDLTGANDGRAAAPSIPAGTLIRRAAEQTMIRNLLTNLVALLLGHTLMDAAPGPPMEVYPPCPVGVRYVRAMPSGRWACSVAMDEPPDEPSTR